MRLHEIQGYIQSVYLAEHEDKLLLLDGCCRCDVPRVLSFIERQLQRPPTDLKLIVVTHMHPDHAGAAHLLRRRVGCEIATGAFERQWYGGLIGALTQAQDIGLAYYVAWRLGRTLEPLHYPRAITPDYQLRGGDPLPGFEDWRVIEAPGHTDRDIALLHGPSGALYVGDAILKVRQRYINPLPLHLPREYRATLDRLEAAAPTRLLMAHGGIVACRPEIFAEVRAAAPREPATATRVLTRAVRRALGLA